MLYTCCEKQQTVLTVYYSNTYGKQSWCNLLLTHTPWDIRGGLQVFVLWMMAPGLHILSWMFHPWDTASIIAPTPFLH